MICGIREVSARIIFWDNEYLKEIDEMTKLDPIIEFREDHRSAGQLARPGQRC